MNKQDQARRTAVEIKFAGVDITKDIRPYLLSVTYTDNEEDKADDLQLSRFMSGVTSVPSRMILKSVRRAFMRSPSSTAASRPRPAVRGLVCSARFPRERRKGGGIPGLLL